MRQWALIIIAALSIAGCAKTEAPDTTDQAQPPDQTENVLANIESSATAPKEEPSKDIRIASQAMKEGRRFYDLGQYARAKESFLRAKEHGRHSAVTWIHACTDRMQEAASPPPQPEATPGPEQRSTTTRAIAWMPIARWSGQGRKNTQPFSARSPWRIRWSAVPRPDNGLGSFSIWVRRPRETRSVELAANVLLDHAGADTSYIYESGQFYLEISGSGKWQVVVEGQQ